MKPGVRYVVEPEKELGIMQENEIKPAHLKCEIGRHSGDNAIILYGICEGCSKEDFNKIMIAANNEKHVYITITFPQGIYL